MEGVRASALASLLEAPKFELIPLRSALEQAAFLPPGATVTVTASPTKPIEATVELAYQLRAGGFVVVPHLSAHMVRDRRHLRELVDRMEEATIDRVFVVGGDSPVPGAFPDGLALLRALEDLGHPFSHIGIPVYPEGHPFIPDDRLLGALREKQSFASYMTTQICFDPRAIGAWIGARRREGITLPVHIGLPGVAPLHKLIALSARIGIGDSRRFLAKNARSVGQMLRGGGFSPNGLLEGLAPILADPAADIRRLHLCTFNQVQATEEWRAGYLAARAKPA